MDTHETVDGLLEAAFPLRSMPRLYSENQREKLVGGEYEGVA
jgi:hypothetical protein